MSLRLYRGGKLAHEDRPELEEADVLVEGAAIKAVGAHLEAPEGAEVIDCAGKVLMPALFDVNVHAREPGEEDKETIETVTEAAINGGVTGVVLMPNTKPPIDNGSLVQTVLERAEQSRIEVLTTGCITKGRLGEDMAGIAGMARAGAVFLTDDNQSVANPQLLRTAMEYARSFGLFIASHCEVAELAGNGSVNEGLVSYSMGVTGIPACAEEICIERDIRLAQHTGTHIHIQHVSTARGMESIRRFKEEGVKVTCEVTPHHLIFNENHIRDFDTNYKMNPPLRTAEDNEALLQGLIDGVFDVIVSDHAPHTEFEKNTDFSNAPFGITGLETALPALFHHFIKSGRMGWDHLVRHYSANPRRLMKREPVKFAEGGPAEFLVFDPDGSTHFTTGFMRSRSSNTPFLDRELDGRIDEVVYRGEVLLRR